MAIIDTLRKGLATTPDFSTEVAKARHKVEQPVIGKKLKSDYIDVQADKAAQEARRRAALSVTK